MPSKSAELPTSGVATIPVWKPPPAVPANAVRPTTKHANKVNNVYFFIGSLSVAPDAEAFEEPHNLAKCKLLRLNGFSSYESLGVPISIAKVVRLSDDGSGFQNGSTWFVPMPMW